MAMDAYHYREHRAGMGSPLLFLFHGTGGDENQLFALGRDLMPKAGLVSPRGDVSEHGALRFFRRTGEGVYDMEDLGRRTAAMIAFVKAQIEDRQPGAVLGLGYSNGANILASAMFSEPELFDAAVLMHPLIPFAPQVPGGRLATQVLLTAGRKDPICPPDLTNRLLSYLEAAGASVTAMWHGGGHELRTNEIAAARQFLAPWRDRSEGDRQ